VKIPTPTVDASWLTRQRVTGHAVILALALWVSGVVNVATPGLVARNGHVKGEDFLHFYTLGAIGREGPSQALYDIKACNQRMTQLVPAAANTGFIPVYGPQVALLFAPISMLPYTAAVVVWALLTTLIYGWCCRAVWLQCPGLRRNGSLVALLALGFPGFWNLFWHGQTSALALLCLTLGWLCLARERDMLAGFAIGGLAFKPQLGLVVGLVLLLTRRWRVVAGAFLSILTQAVVAWAWFGTSVLEAYARRLSELGRLAPFLEPRPYQLHSLNGFFKLLLPWSPAATAAYLLTAAGVLAITVFAWTRLVSLGLRYAMVLIATVLVAPHLTVYDLVVLAPALLFAGDWALRHPGPLSDRIRVVLYASYALPAIGPFAAITRVQLSVLAFITLLILLAEVTRAPEAMEVESRPSSEVLRHSERVGDAVP
jgi:hypothetical protein